MFNKPKKFVIIFVVLAFALGVYGNNWGLPSRWYVDEKVANALHMLSGRTLVDAYDFYYHPTGHQLFLAICMIPFFAALKLIGYPVEALKDAASVSWMHMAKLFPEFAVNIYIYSRALSALLGALTVYLIYLIGRRIYNEKAGVLSAAFLSVTMGFIGVSHFAKYTSLEIFFVALTLLFCVRNSLFWAALMAGISVSVQLDAVLLLAPLTAVLLLNAKSFKRVILSGCGMLLLYAAGFIAATPSFLTHSSEYIQTFKGLFASNSTAAGTQKLPFFVGPLNYFFELSSIYGVLIFGLILWGVWLTARNYRKLSKGEIIISVFALAYLLVMTVLSDDTYPQTKHIICVVPILILFAGRAGAGLLESKRFSLKLRACIIALVFLYSLCYTFRADLVFARTDTRYKSTEWILANIPKGSKIETFDQLNYICSDSVFDSYDFIYMGRSSKSFKGKMFFKWDKVENREEYLKRINKYDCDSDFIIVSVENLNELYSSTVVPFLPGLPQYMAGLFDGKKNYELVKTFTAENKKVSSSTIKGFYYPQSLFWNPIPSPDVVSPAIYVFKRKI